MSLYRLSLLNSKLSLQLLLMLTLQFVMPTASAGEHNHSVAEEAHVHGIAELQLVLEGQQLELQLRSPAMNLVGFEHQPKNAKQRDAVLRVGEQLQEAENIIRINGGDCELVSRQIDMGGLLSKPAETHQQADEHDHNHKGHHDDHHDGSHEKDDQQDHSSLEAHYRYNCGKPEKIQSLQADLLNEFKAVEHLQVMWIFLGRQGAATLNASERIIHFR